MKKSMSISSNHLSFFSELEAKIRELEQSLLVERDTRDTESHSLRLEIESLTRSLDFVKQEYTVLTKIASKIVSNVRLVDVANSLSSRRGIFHILAVAVLMMIRS